MAFGFDRDQAPLARALIRIADEAIACEDDTKLREYFAEDYAFHGAVGDLSFEELSAFRLKAPRSAGLAASSRRCRSTA